MKNNIIIFGAGNTGVRYYEENHNKYNIIGFIDNDETKWGGKCCGKSVFAPISEEISKYDFDYILICCVQAEEKILNQLVSIGISIDRIKVLPKTDFDNEARRNIYIKLKQDFDELGVKGSVAELGVFRGDEARVLNDIFNDSRLYLFDTFEGFDERDVYVENIFNHSQAKQKQFNDTSIEIVKRKLPNPENVKIYKGYFPDTWENISDLFLLVRIDMDLYQPTVAALDIFHRRMCKGGVILLHDYYGNSYCGVKKAVDEYLDKYRCIRKMPIGDSLSCLLIGY